MNAFTLNTPTAAATIPPAGMLASKAMLATLSISGWSARKLDREITDETNARHNASADAGRYNKLLIPAAALTPINKVSGEARTFHYARTLPWADNGGRVLLAAAYRDYSDNMRAFRQSFESSVATFLDSYPSHVATAADRLNGMFDPADYPASRDVARKFGFAIAVDPIPQSADFRVDVGSNAAAIIRAEIEERTAAMVGDAMRSVYGRVADVVGAMSERLTHYKPGTDSDRESGGFKRSLIGNIKELVDLLPSLNLTADTRLASISDRMKNELCGYDFDELKSDEFIRIGAATAAADILATVMEFMA